MTATMICRSNTMRRDVLRRMCEAGRLVMTGSYHYDDNLGGERRDMELPVRIMPANWQDRVEGFAYIRADEFTSQVGHAYRSGDRVQLHVHSNSNYTLRILPS